MRIHLKLVLSALAAAIMLAAAVGTASAGLLSVSNRNIRALFDNLTFDSPSGGAQVVCDVTIEGSFHSATMRKVVGALVGFISRATVYKPGCSGIGRAEVNQGSLPWHIRYRGFTGSLPLFTAVLLEMNEPEFTILEPFFGLTCLYKGSMWGEFIRSTRRLRSETAHTIPKIGGTAGGFCPSAGILEGEGPVLLLGTTASIEVRLI